MRFDLSRDSGGPMIVGERAAGCWCMDSAMRIDIALNRLASQGEVRWIVEEEERLLGEHRSLLLQVEIGSLN
jgi:hypothetical protein